MDNEDNINFLFAIATVLKCSFATPVIFVTMKDYADDVFKSLREMHSALVNKASSLYKVSEIISQFHYNWLEAVREIEDFKKRICSTPRDNMNKAIKFSIECVNKRNSQFNKYIERFLPTSNKEEYQLMQGNLQNMIEMCDNLISSLQDKQTNFSVLVDPAEYYQKVSDEIDELFNWLDMLYDNLASQFSKVTDLKLQPNLATELTKALQQIIDNITVSTNIDADKIAEQFESTSRTLLAVVRLGTTDDLKINEIVEKIIDFKSRIQRLRNEDSSAVMALQHKTLYLEERLKSLENLRHTRITLKSSCKYQAQGQIHAFDHLLPLDERCRLIEDFVKIWTKTVFGIPEFKSIISILSDTDMKEIFTDEFGKFTIDKYGRKLYMGPNKSNYQLNEFNELIPLNDDDDHVYFYDSCGRHFYNDKNERIYKVHETASEYIMSDKGTLLKLKEYRNGNEFWFDQFGRYFLDENRKRIYCDSEGELYENDGLGNLICIRSTENLNYETCPLEPLTSEASIYLQKTVGSALKKCIAAVVLRQPYDPILYLAMSLEDYQMKEEARKARLREEQELKAEREERMRDIFQALTEPASDYSSEGELLCSDPNLLNYHTVESVGL